MRLRLLSALGAFALLAALLLSVSAASGAGGTSTQNYIVRMLEKPVAAYTGGVEGIPATKPDKGQKIDDENPNVVRYAAFLDSKHAVLAQKIGARKLYDYRFAYNGFVAELTEGQARALEADPAVLSVEKDATRQLDTSNTPSFMGLTGNNGAWSKLGGVGNAGENVIIGLLDSGIVVPTHPSFSDRDPRLRFVTNYSRVPNGWLNKNRCQAGEGWRASDCNRKVIGAQYFNAGFGVDRIAERDFLSPRDWNGHGSHTASTAGGNNNVQATGDAAAFGAISGMAPRARIAMYKVCWESEEGAGCANSDSVAAIDKAIADGVDVLNFSISGTSTNYLDAVEVAFLFAADAGVFVATSAGNSGPTASTVAHISPWLAAVAAGTHSRRGTGTITLGNGATHTGNSVTRAVASAPLVRSSAVGRAGAAAESVRLCFNTDVLDPAKATNKIVVCDRGGNVLVDKAAAVKAAGGVGMILANTTVPASANTTFGILHVVPTVHVVAATGDLIKAYIDAAPASATASFGAALFTNDNPSPLVAGFSSRGPSRAGGGDILKPDFMAPGEDILAAVAPEGNNGRDFDLFSGTSMSSPHVAGFGALLTQAHPDWSPAAMRSALSTTADPSAGAVFDVGAGQVNPTKSLDPGLVFDAGFNDYRNFLKGQGLCNFCFGPEPATGIDASDLNQPSIAIGDLAGSQEVSRTATSVGSQSETYIFSITGLSGVTATPSVASFTAAPGSVTPWKVSFLRTTAPFAAFASGTIVWTGDKGHVVRMPVTIRPVRIAAPAEVSGNGSAPLTWTAKAGYIGTLNAPTRGLAPATATTFTLLQDPDQTFDPAVTTGTFSKNVTVPGGGASFRAGIYEDAITPTGTDLDLYVYIGPTLVGLSADGDSNEEVTLRNTGASPVTYTIYVHGWLTNGPSANVTLFDWVVSTSAANMVVTPASTPVTTGQVVNYTATFSGLAAATRYLGVVEYNDGSLVIGRTYVSVRTP